MALGHSFLSYPAMLPCTILTSRCAQDGVPDTSSPTRTSERTGASASMFRPWFCSILWIYTGQYHTARKVGRMGFHCDQLDDAAAMGFKAPICRRYLGAWILNSPRWMHDSETWLTELVYVDDTTYYISCINSSNGHSEESFAHW